MALRKLVEGDCGGVNPLVEYSSHFVQDRALKDEGLRTYPHSEASMSNANTDQLVHDFLEETMSHSTQPFRMDSLLAEMRDIEYRTAPVTSAPISQLAIEGDVLEWAQQYIEDGKHFQEHTEPGIWTTNDRKDSLDNFSDSGLGIGPRWAYEYLQRTSSSILEEPPLADLSNSEEYESKNEELVEIADDLLSKTSGDPRFQYSKFMKFMKQISDGEVSMEDEVVSDESVSKAEHWSLEYDQGQQERDVDENWTEQFLRGSRVNSKDNESLLNKNKIWESFTKQWENFASALSKEKWTTEFADYSSEYKNYLFTEDNPMTDISDPLKEGLNKLRAGDLPSAVLCFEAACLKEPDNSLAWQLLGTTQAENEQDPLAIAAFKKCLELSPDNLIALMSIAVCYTNENYQNQACRALKEWLRMNPKYSDLVPTEEENPNSAFLGVTSFMTRDMHDKVKEMFLQAARRNPVELDPDVQCGLGVLYNLSLEINKAVDCFRAALQVKPDDAPMWNRLGATLANGDRSEEAVDAYRSALQLSPGFIRARYNLGISCLHLGAYKEAAEHLLIALNQQAAGRGPQGASKTIMSNTIWNTLRLVVNLLERKDLDEHVTLRNLSVLNQEFGME